MFAEPKITSVKDQFPCKQLKGPVKGGVVHTIRPGMARRRPMLHRCMDRVYNTTKPLPSVATKPRSITQTKHLDHL